MYHLEETVKRLEERISGLERQFTFIQNWSDLMQELLLEIHTSLQEILESTNSRSKVEIEEFGKKFDGIIESPLHRKWS